MFESFKFFPFISTKQSATSISTGYRKSTSHFQDYNTINDWENPIEISHTNLEALPLRRDMLPGDISDFVFSTALRLNNAPPEYVAVSLLASFAAILGNSVVIRPKQKDTSFSIVPTLWAALVGPPSYMKTPCMSAVLGIIHKATDEYFDGKPSEQIVLNDITKEALAISLAQSQRGVLFNKDEISGWLNILRKEERAEERAFFLEAFNGDGRYVQRRVTREQIVIDPAIVSLLGGLQPSKIKPLLKERSCGVSDDGLFERVQLLVYPENKQQFVDIAPDPLLYKKMSTIAVNFLEQRNESDTKIFSFDDKAYDLYRRFSQELIEGAHGKQDQEGAVLLKYPSLVCKLSLIFYLLSADKKIIDVSPKIDVCSLSKAIDWSELLLSHQNKILNFTRQGEVYESTKSLLQNLEKLSSPFSFRDLSRKKWRSLTSSEDCKAAISALITSKHLKKEVSKDKGRTKVVYHINPRI